MKSSETELKVLLTQELENYFQKKGSFKEYYLSMKEINRWLQESVK